MGLRHLAEAFYEKKQLQPALNNDSSSKMENVPLFFRAEESLKNFLFLVGIEKGGFLIKNNENFYELCFASGFDITTFHRCVIPASTLQPLISSPLTEWTVLTSGNFRVLRNFFSSQEYISITDMFLFPIDGDNVFLFLVKSQKDSSREMPCFLNSNSQEINCALQNFITGYSEFKTVFEAARPVYPFQFGENAILLKIESALKAKNFAGLINFSFEELFPDSIKLQHDVSVLRMYYSMVNKILQIIGKSNISVLKTNRQIYICLFSAQKLPEDMYIGKIKSVISAIYGKEFCNKLIINYAGSSQDIKKITDFLQLDADVKTS